jgi:Zn-dependent M28 family amino/carboxypeptidase
VRIPFFVGNNMKTLIDFVRPLFPGLALLLASSSGFAASAPEKLSPEAKQWWADISAIADDSTEGRQTGSRGYLRSADYVMSRFKAEGLKPAGVDGYLQPIAFEQQIVDQSASSADLTSADGTVTTLHAGEDMIIAAGGGPRPAHVEAPLVFVGYGLHLPERGHDDFAGVDLKGKIAVVLSGGPADIAGTIKANARFTRAELLGQMGAIGFISLTTPNQTEIPWVRQKVLARQPGMYLADPDLRNTPDGFFAASVDAEKADLLFKGSGHTFAELCAIADSSGSLPQVTIPQQLRATISASHEYLNSPNLVAMLAGSDPRLASEFIAISAHLDHLGVAAPADGGQIFSGAMDDASGVAAVLDIAHRMKKAVHRPRRSILFGIFTAEEKGLLGSHYYAMRPTVPKGSIVAELNYDMPLPLWPLKSVLAQGDGESTLGADARAVAHDSGLTLIADPLPDRNSFIRTDQFSFVREGIPSLAFKFGFAKDTPEFQIEHEWRATRYHSPNDNLQQPGVLKNEAVKLDAFVAGIALRVANADARPEWLSTSIFRK